MRIHIRLVSVSKIVFPPLAIIAAVGDDPSSKMWILSITHADKHDSGMVERWKADMDGILIYVRFFKSLVGVHNLFTFENGL